MFSGQKESAATISEAEEGISRLRRNPTQVEYRAEVELQQAVAVQTYIEDAQEFYR